MVNHIVNITKKPCQSKAKQGFVILRPLVCHPEAIADRVSPKL